MVQSPIVSIQGDLKIPNAREILDDPEQRNKWFSVWIWNYFRQILNENTIKTHNKQQVEVSQPANIMVAALILNQLKVMKARNCYYDKYQIDKGDDLEVFCNCNEIDVSFDHFLEALFRAYKVHGIEGQVTEYSIQIKCTKEPPIVSDIITTEDPVMMLSFNTPTKDDGEGSWQDVLEHNRLDNSDENDDLDLSQSDMLETIRANLPNGDCEKIMEIYVQSGPVWEEFSKNYQAGGAKSHIAEFLGISAKKVEECRKRIEKVIRFFSQNEENLAIKEKAVQIIDEYDQDVEELVSYGREHDEVMLTVLEDTAIDLKEKGMLNTAALFETMAKEASKGQFNITEERIFDSVFEDVTRVGPHLLGV